MWSDIDDQIADAGAGFEVNAPRLTGLAHAADEAGHSVSALGARAKAALALGVPGGLGIGAAIGRAAGAWETRLADLAGAAASVGTRLAANAASYQQTEADVLATLALDLALEFDLARGVSAR